MIAAAIVGLAIGYIGVALAAFHLHGRVKKLEVWSRTWAITMAIGQQEIRNAAKDLGEKSRTGSQPS